MISLVACGAFFPTSCSPQTGTLACTPRSYPDTVYAWTDPDCFHTLYPIEGGYCEVICEGEDEPLDCTIDPTKTSNTSESLNGHADKRARRQR